MLLYLLILERERPSMRRCENEDSRVLTKSVDSLAVRGEAGRWLCSYCRMDETSTSDCQACLSTPTPAYTCCCASSLFDQVPSLVGGLLPMVFSFAVVLLAEKVVALSKKGPN
jgi:hypothetical protein